MLGLPPSPAPEKAPIAQHHVPPGARELRAQAVHRLQVGLFGLAMMLLLVGLANIIMDRARLTEASNPVGAVVSGAGGEGAGSDPLAEIGVVPAAEPTPAASPEAGGGRDAKRR